MLPELVDYLSKGPCIVVVGAGLSSEIGLPDWSGLAEEILEALRKANPKDLEAAELDFAQNNFPSLLGRAWRGVSPALVIESCKKVLMDTGKSGSGYCFVVKFPFKGYLTTNLEHILARHFSDAEIAITQLGNTKADLEQVDFDALHCVVNIHGTLDDPDNLVLTDDQYDAVLHDSRFDSLRFFITSHLSTARVLFIGYSLSDPDLQFLLKRISHKLRRSVPMFAIIANAGETVIDDWDRKYNIQIVPYHARKGDHGELKHLLDILSRYVALRGEQITSIPSLKVAQSLYMWHRFQSTSHDAPRVDAFKALVLAALTSTSKSLSKSALTEAVATMASMKAERIGPSISAALDSAIKDGLVEAPTAQLFKPSTKGKETHDRFAKQFDNLKAEFLEQVKLDSRKALPHTSAADASLVADAALDALVVCMAERGAEIVDMIFGDRRDHTPHVTLLKEINVIALRLPERFRYFFTSYVTRLLTAPTGVHERFLEYLAKAYFTVHAVGLDPDGELIRKALIDGHSLVIDSNVLIPTLTVDSANNALSRAVLEKALSAGITVWVTPRFIDETLQHFQWASDLVKEHGEQSIEVLAASMGRGHYRRNEFLDGFIRHVADGHKRTFEEYVDLCIGGLNFNSIKDKAAEFGIQFLPMAALTKDNAEFYVVRDQSEEFINSSATEMPEIYKSEARMRAESEVYAVIYSWEKLRPANRKSEQWRCSFLSRGTFLNKVAVYGPYKIDRNITVRPELLYEFLCRFEGAGNLKVPLKDLLLATYFRSASYFIDKEKYSRFFAPLLRETERTYADNVESFRRLVSSKLDSNSLKNGTELERPFALLSLDAEAKDVLRQEVHRLDDENAELKSRYETAEKEIAKLRLRLKSKK
jgi:predicted nucleic acid-binding protein